MKTELYGVATVNALRWIGRIVAFVVLLLWGGFFIEHMQEWFIKPFPHVPPAKVWVGQILHFLILLGLLLVMKWPLPGALLVIVASVAFFSRVAGSNAPLFIGFTCLPALVLLFCWWASRNTLRISQAPNMP